jgi:hypothetical protein
MNRHQGRRVLFASGSPVACGTFALELSEGFAMTGKRGLWRRVRHCPAWGDGAVADVVLRDVGCPKS